MTVSFTNEFTGVVFVNLYVRNVFQVGLVQFGETSAKGGVDVRTLVECWKSSAN
jgi:hypothetical protein